jgi:ribose transport system substrate-binding protein
MQQWNGRVDELVLVELSIAGAFLRSRLNGVEMGVREILPSLTKVTRLACSGQFSGTMETVRQYLKTTRARRILLGAVNDPCALGALRAFEETGWQDPYAVVGQGGAIEARRELRRRGTHLIGTVGFFPETYGESIMRIAVNLLNARAKPSAVFTKHQLITAANVDRFYPNDLELHISAPPVARVERRPC